MGTPAGAGPDNYVATNNAQEQEYCDQYNREAYARYTQTIANLNVSLDAGRPAPSAAPPVPTKMALSAPDKVTGLQWAVMTPDPIGPEIPLHPDLTHVNDPPPPNSIVIGLPVPGGPGWWTAGKGDSIPNGKTVPGTSQDGVTGLWEKFGAAVGNGWYEKVG